MKYIGFNQELFIPANKICEVAKDKENKIVIWLDGGQMQSITFDNKEDRDRNYTIIVNTLKEL